MMVKAKPKYNGCVKAIETAVKVMVAHDRLMGMTAEAVAKKHGVTTKSISTWENHDDTYIEIVAQAGRDIRRQCTGALIGGMAGLSRKVMKEAMSEEGGDLGFKILKELGAFKTGGREVGMTQDEVQAAGGVTIMVMGAVGSDGTPVIDVDAVVDGDVDVNES